MISNSEEILRVRAQMEPHDPRRLASSVVGALVGDCRRLVSN